MKTVALLIADKNTLVDNSTRDEFLKITIKKLKKFTDEIYILGEKTIEDNNIHHLEFSTSYELLDFFQKKLDNVTLLILNAYSPLFDVKLTEEMLENHKKYVFDYTYAENLPYGLLPELFETSIVKFLINKIPKSYPIFTRSIKELFEKEISSYDCNIFVTNSQLLKFRIDFIPSNINSLNMLKSIIQNYGYDLSINEIEDLLLKNPLLMRYTPTYFEIELSTEREGGEIFISKRLQREGYLKLEDFERILSEISTFSINPVINLGLFGEPFLHPDILSIIEILGKYREINFLIESRSLFNTSEPIIKALTLENVKLIFDISFTDQANFTKYKSPLNPILPKKDLPEIESIINSLPGKEKIYIQFTRTKVNENELITFYKKWKDFSDRIIVKKLDTFCGLLDNMRVVDLSPVKRFFCYHLKNDLVIFYNGDVPLCREDFNGKYLMGNILSDGIKKVWENIQSYYIEHFKGNFIPEELCKQCDEWWIFNF